MAILVPRQPVKLTVTNQGVVEGYGVRAAHEIPSRTLVLKFTGRSYSNKEEAERDRTSVRSQGIIIFRTNKGGGRWIVPDRQCQARYLNTSADKVSLCNNYLHFRTIWFIYDLMKDQINIHSYDVGPDEVWLYSTRTIAKDEELLLEY